MRVTARATANHLGNQSIVAETPQPVCSHGGIFAVRSKGAPEPESSRSGEQRAQWYIHVTVHDHPILMD